MRDSYESILGLDAEVVAISADTLAVARQAVIDARLPYPVLSDAGLAVIDRYGVRHIDELKGRSIARPSVFVLDREGIVRYLHVGEHERDRPTVEALLLALETID